MTLYNRVNNIIGWIIFIFSTAVYLMTAESTGSFWDCGEFISCAYKLQVAHSPGAPLFIMVAHLFTLLAGDPSNVALMVNYMSGIFSGLTVLFLFWTITALAKKIIGKKEVDIAGAELIAIMGAAIIGAIAYTFADSFWFSAVEGEVYAMSAFFTAIVFWGILKWDNAADQPHADRWILFIAYMVGLSIGVHLLGLLVIPAMVLVYGFRKFPVTRWNVIKTLAVGIIILGAIQYGIIPGIPKLAAKFDITFVNDFGLPFNSGVAFFFAMVIVALAFGIRFSTSGSDVNFHIFSVSLILALFGWSWIATLIVLAIYIGSFLFTKNYTLTFFLTFTGILPGYLLWLFLFKDTNKDPWRGRPNPELNKVLLTITLIIIGYSSYLMVVIRASANPSINMSSPKDPIALLGYLNREQYGDRPLLYGEVFTSTPIDVDRESGEMRYFRDKDKYVELGRKPIIKYAPQDKMLFPRVWDNNDPSHVRFYRNWLNLKEGEKPTFGDNMNFFITYQVGFMYWRYFMWNFSGRQDDIQGTGDIQHGNWITGYPFIDNAMLGDQQNLPVPLNDNKGRNKLYLIPFVLGLVGLVYHFRKNKLDAWVVLSMFFFTGLAVVIYLNQPPLQPRERDYAYAGSFYSFSIWVGLAVMALYEYMKARMNPRNAAILATVICLLGPVIMGAKEWNDHDRSNRYTARDFGRNYLESCAPNAILFTQGDNDTYPLWYAQEVEGIRPDVRVVNLSLLGVDWYIDGLRRKVNQSEAVLISVDSSKYRGSNRDYIRFYANKSIAQNQSYSLSSVLDFLFSEDSKNMVDAGGGEQINYLPAKNVFIPIDKQQVIANNVVHPSDTAKILPRIEWQLNKNTLLKNDLMTLEILRTNLWKRPIYFAISVAPDAYLGLNNYFQQEGLSYRVVPFTSRMEDGLPGGVQPDIMYGNLMHKFAWGGVDQDKKIYLDENILRMVTNLRTNFSRLAAALIAENKKDSALQVLDKCVEVLPERNVPLSFLNLSIAKNYYEVGANEKGRNMLDKLLTIYSDQLRYYTSLPVDKRSYFTGEINEGVYVLNTINEMTEKNNDMDLNKKSQEAFQRYVNFYTPQKQ